MSRDHLCTTAHLAEHDAETFALRDTSCDSQRLLARIKREDLGAKLCNWERVIAESTPDDQHALSSQFLRK